MAYNEDHHDKKLHQESASFFEEDEVAQPEADDHFDLPGYQFQEDPQGSDDEDFDGDACGK